MVYSLQHAFVDHLNDIDNFTIETAICDIFMLHLWEPQVEFEQLDLYFVAIHA